MRVLVPKRDPKKFSITDTRRLRTRLWNITDTADRAIKKGLKHVRPRGSLFGHLPAMIRKARQLNALSHEEFWEKRAEARVLATMIERDLTDSVIRAACLPDRRNLRVEITFWE